MSILNKEVTPAVAAVEFTLDDQAGFVAMSQTDLVERMTVTGEDGTVALPSVSALTTAACSAEQAPKGAIRMLAARINIMLPAVDGSQDWFDTVATDSTAMAKAFEPTRKDVTNTARARNHSNPAQLIKQVKEQGRILRDGKEPVIKDAEPRDVFKRMSEDLLVLYKWGNTARTDPLIKKHVEREKIEAGLVGITKTLTAMGIDLTED